MIHVNIVRDKQGFIWEFTVEGHAGAGEEGNDIVCAAVSVVAYTAVNALDELVGIGDCCTIEDGYMKCSLPVDIPEEKKQVVRVIMDTVAVGFKQIEYTEQYESYISVLEEEV